MENINLIDWRMVAFASLWIIGLASLLSAISFAYYQAQTRQIRVRKLLSERGYQVVINLSLALFSIGLLGSASPWWERILWGLLALAFIYFSIASWKNRGGDGSGQRDLEG